MDVELNELRRQFRCWVADPANVQWGSIVGHRELMCVRYHLQMADGRTLSVQSSHYHYCTVGSTFEVYCWSESTNPFEDWDDGPASHVDEDTLLSYIQAHGGFAQPYGAD